MELENKKKTRQKQQAGIQVVDVYVLRISLAVNTRMFCIVEDCSFPNPFFCGRVEGRPTHLGFQEPTVYAALNASLLYKPTS